MNISIITYGFQDCMVTEEKINFEVALWLKIILITLHALWR